MGDRDFKADKGDLLYLCAVCAIRSFMRLCSSV